MSKRSINSSLSDKRSKSSLEVVGVVNDNIGDNRVDENIEDYRDDENIEDYMDDVNILDNRDDENIGDNRDVDNIGAKVDVVASKDIFLSTPVIDKDAIIKFINSKEIWGSGTNEVFITRLNTVVS